MVHRTVINEFFVSGWDTETLDISAIEACVLDEADTMLDYGEFLLSVSLLILNENSFPPSLKQDFKTM